MIIIFGGGRWARPWRPRPPVRFELFFELLEGILQIQAPVVFIDLDDFYHIQQVIKAEAVFQHTLVGHAVAERQGDVGVHIYIPDELAFPP